MILSIFVLVGIGIVIWLVTSAQKRAEELETRQQAVEQYTEQVGGVLEAISGPAGEMVEVTQVPEEGDLKDLAADAEKWQTDLVGAQSLLAQVLPSEEAEPTNQLFNEAVALYGSAAQIFGQLADAPNQDARLQLFNNASTQRDLASAIFQSAIAGFDVLRAELDLGGSGLDAPVTGPPPMPEQSEIPLDTETIEGSDDEGSGGSGGNKGNGKKDNGSDSE